MFRLCSNLLGQQHLYCGEKISSVLGGGGGSPHLQVVGEKRMIANLSALLESTTHAWSSSTKCHIQSLSHYNRRVMIHPPIVHLMSLSRTGGKGNHTEGQNEGLRHATWISSKTFLPKEIIKCDSVICHSSLLLLDSQNSSQGNKHTTSHLRSVQPFNLECAVFSDCAIYFRLPCY